MGIQHFKEGILLPTVGLGARFQQGHFGCDLSASLGSVIVINELKGKALCLWYPYPESKHRFYCGVGPGVSYALDLFNTRSFITAEGLIGFEFKHARFFKTFLQLELSQPVHRLSAGRHFPASAALSFGLGF